MKPIADDTIHRLLDRLDRHERRALELAEMAGSPVAEILDFAAADGRYDAPANLERARRARARRRTVSGVFTYVAQL